MLRNASVSLCLILISITLSAQNFVKKIETSFTSANGNEKFALNGKTLFFSHQGGLWVTDGNITTTKLITPSDLVVNDILTKDPYQNEIYFATSQLNGRYGNELWKTDGTVEGTKLIKRFGIPYNSSTVIRQMKVAGDKLYFTVFDQLWVIKDKSRDPELIMDKLYAYYLDSFKDKLCFMGSSDVTYSQYTSFFFSDGSTKGTYSVTDSLPGNLSNYVNRYGSAISYSKTDKYIYFYTYPWRSDGTKTGTEKIILPPNNPASYDGYRNNITTNNKSYYSYDNRIWRLDDDSKIPVPITFDNQYVEKIIPDGEKVYYMIRYTNNNIINYQLWITDGTANGNIMLKDMQNIVAYFSLYKIFKGRLFFNWNGQLWETNGTPVGTINFNNFGETGNWYELNGKVYFSAARKQAGITLKNTAWETDGTLAGTKPLVAGADLIAVSSIFASSEAFYYLTGIRDYSNASFTIYTLPAISVINISSFSPYSSLVNVFPKDTLYFRQTPVVGTGTNLTLYISNTGAADLALSKTVLTGKNFKLISPLPSVVKAGGTDSLIIQFKPSEITDFKEKLYIYSNDNRQNGVFEINLKGNGIAGGVAEEDFQALVSLYKNNGGEIWGKRYGWNIEQNNVSANWQGITIDSGRVVGIALYELTGELTPQIGKLKALKTLNLTGRSLSGNLPVELFNLSRLENLTITGTQITGKIPNQVGRLTQLKGLWLNDNQLTGGISDSLVNLKLIRSLDLSTNQLNGKIPAFLANLTSLFYINLNYNKFTEIVNADYSQRKNLEFNVVGNLISSIPPPESWNQIYQATLRFQNNLLNFSDLKPYVGKNLYLNRSPQGYFGNIEYVKLEGTTQNITLTLPEDMKEAGNTFQWTKDGYAITGATQSTYTLTASDLTSDGIYSCEARNPDLPGQVLIRNQSFIQKPISNEEFLALKAFFKATHGEKWFNKSGWDTTSNTVNNSWYGVQISNGYVKSLGFNNGNNLTGTLPKELGNLKSLQLLGLSYNQLTGAIPAELFKIKTLKNIYFNFNQLTGSLPAVDSLINTQMFSFANNKLSGEIPKGFSKMQQLQLIDLTNNQFSGSLPKEINTFPNLSKVYLSNNRFKGSVPSSWSNLTQKHVNIQLDNNQIDSLPKFYAEFFSGTNYRHIAISGNKLTFADLEPNLGAVSYAINQDSLGTAASYQLNKGDSLLLESPERVGGEANVYQWYKDGGIIVGATQKVYKIKNASIINDAGLYYCKVTNLVIDNSSVSQMKGLVLYRRPILVKVNDNTPILTISPNITTENVPAGSLLGVLSVNNTTESFVFSLENGTGSSDNALFRIEGNKVLTSGKLDFEASNPLRIRVKATSGINTFSQELKINITDEKESSLQAVCKEQIQYLGVHLNDVCFADATTVFAVGDKGVILKSINGGESWKEVRPATLDIPLNKIKFVNNKIGFAYYSTLDAYSNPYPIVLQTTDGGENWRKWKDSNNTSTDNIEMLNDSTFYRAIRDNFSSWTLHKTTDGGRNWTKISNIIARQGIYFVDQMTGYVVNGAFIYKTTDGGKTYTSQLLGQGAVSLFYALSANIQYAIIGNTLYKTKDGWNSWTINTIDIKFGTLIKLVFTDENTGYACTDNYGSSKLIKTTDGGVTWSEINADPYMNSFAVKGNRIITVGKSGNIRYSIDNGINWNIISDRKLTWQKVSFFDDRIGVAYNGFDENDKYVTYNFRTEDGGRTWKTIDIPDLGKNTFGQVFVQSKQRAYGLFNDEFIYKTADTGKTWQKLGKNTANIQTIFNMNGNFGLARDNYNNTYQTSDEGATWQPRLDLNPYSIYFMKPERGYFMKADSLYLVTDGGLFLTYLGRNEDLRGAKFFFNDDESFGFAVGSYLSVTRDGGYTWQRIDSFTLQDFKGIAFKNENEIYMLLGVTIYKSTDKGATWIIYLSNNGQDYFTNIKSVNGRVIGETLVYAGYKRIFDILSTEPKPFIADFIRGKNKVTAGTSEYYRIDTELNTQYRWELSGGGTFASSDNEVFVNWTTPGTYTIRVYAGKDCIEALPSELVITVLPKNPEIKGTVITNNNTKVLKGKVILYKKDNSSFNYIEDVVLIKSNEFIFGNLMQGEYVIKVNPDTLAYPTMLPTYSGNKLILADAVTASTTNPVIIQLIEKNNLQTGEYSLQGLAMKSSDFREGKISWSNKITTGEALANSMIYLQSINNKQTTLTVTTNSEGKFSFTKLPEGTYTVLVDMNSIPMDERSKNISLSGDNKEYIVTITVGNDKISVNTSTQKPTATDEDREPFQLFIFPNPVSQKLNVKFGDGSPNYVDLIITDMIGREYYTIKRISSEKVHTLEVDKWANGVYLIQIIHKDYKSVHKFIKN